MIVNVPEYKKIAYKKNILNESSLFTDIDDIFSDDDDLNALGDYIHQRYEEETLKPRTIRVLQELDVENFEIECTGNGILVNVNDNLYLPHKKLDKLGTHLFKFNIVKGSCNFTGNNLQDWSVFPAYIYGNCYANFNNIKRFNGVPEIEGKLIANKQNKKTKYPLTDENYRKYKSGLLTENKVYSLKYNKAGELCSIDESNNLCKIKFDDNTILNCKLNEVEYFGNITNLLL